MKRSGMQAGFTLLEVLVAISVSAVLVSLVYGAIRVSHTSWESGRARIDESETRRIGWRFLHGALNRARVLDDPLSDGPGILFEGGPDSLRFVADMPAWLGLGGLYLVEIGSVEKDGRRQLQLERVLLSEYRQADTDNHVHRAILSGDLASFDIRYFGSNEPDSPPAWRNTWREVQALPLLIELQVNPRDRPAWPILIARPQFGGQRAIDGESLEAAR
jgi:general secretion pathway protein J